MLAAQVAKGRTRQEAEQLLASRYPKLAAVLGKSVPKQVTGQAADSADFWTMVDQQVARGVPKPRAISTVAREHPEAYRAMLADHNDLHADARRTV